MEKTINDLVALAEDEGTRVLLDDDLIREYITANMGLIIDEIRLAVYGKIY